MDTHVSIIDVLTPDIDPASRMIVRHPWIVEIIGDDIELLRRNSESRLCSMGLQRSVVDTAGSLIRLRCGRTERARADFDTHVATVRAFLAVIDHAPAIIGIRQDTPGTPDMAMTGHPEHRCRTFLQARTSPPTTALHD